MLDQVNRTCFDKLVDRKVKNPFDIEHIVPNQHTPYKADFPSVQEFQEWRNNIGGLLLLPADVNRSLQDKPFDKKVPHYGNENLLAASLTDSVYQHQPQFAQFRQQNNLPFKAYQSFGKPEQKERRELVLALVQKIWSPERFKAI